MSPKRRIVCCDLHDYYADIFDHVNLGLFGGLIVRDHRRPEPDLEVPFFLHRLPVSAHGHRAGHAETGFDSGTLLPGVETFAHTFPDEGTFEDFCRFHPMQGIGR